MLHLLKLEQKIYYLVTLIQLSVANIRIGMQ
jgi:hypothetical protein